MNNIYVVDLLLLFASDSVLLPELDIEIYSLIPKTYEECR